jgi:hypothetical protein
MATPPDFTNGTPLDASSLNEVGLWLVQTQAVGSTPVTSVSVPDCFNNDFVNYRVVYDGIVCSVLDTTLFVRPGGDTTAGSYNSGGYFVLYTGTGVGYLTSSGTSGGIAIGITSTGNTAGAFDIYNPNTAIRTRAMGMWSGDLYNGQYGGVHTVAAAYTSLTLVPFSGTMAGGTIRVYGYRK